MPTCTLETWTKPYGFLPSPVLKFTIRHDGVNEGKRWVRLGTETSYIALAERSLGADTSTALCRFQGINHLAFVVDDADTLGSGY